MVLEEMMKEGRGLCPVGCLSLFPQNRSCGGGAEDMFVRLVSLGASLFQTEGWGTVFEPAVFTPPSLPASHPSLVFR